MQEPSIWKIQNCNGADYLVAQVQCLLKSVLFSMIREQTALC